MKASIKKLSILGLLGIMFAAVFLAGATFGRGDSPLAPENVVYAASVILTRVLIQEDWSRVQLEADLSGLTPTNIEDLVLTLTVKNSTTSQEGSGTAPTALVREVRKIPSPGPPNP